MEWVQEGMEEKLNNRDTSFWSFEATNRKKKKLGDEVKKVCLLVCKLKEITAWCSTYGNDLKKGES